MRRVVFRRGWLCGLCAILLGVLFAMPADAAARRVGINARAAVVMDAESGTLLYSKNADLPLYPASTTKLMTAILLVTHLNPEDPVYVSEEAARQPSVRLGLKPDTTITAEDALHAVLMKSANDVAYAVAQTVGGSQEGFARMMNLKARLIGCTHTNFVTPNGLHEDEHLSTAHDIALILREALRHPRIVAALQTKQYTVAGKTFRNGNRFLYLEAPPFGEVIGGKTGYTSKAMYCLAFAARQDGRVRISVVLGAPRKSLMYRETRRLLEYAQQDARVQLV
ncbi:D-alanyl-D-alanine carboxypeptidase family protein [Alicyclobacillus macrosporangiidus]|jgi:D-alanyl-D-alanine carboxypeptidase|uniref:D-alanyl-D-alanine carboxypeptidase/D-alanyl-D-alanine carboxypeptidase (Penicillin-binding protein 5/6) n=1 Tax=Alicyclobacillus macrosporangiidus TaxID=392015 RepID=A0A1I7L384_9BACL|nr:D-alanyl-D-alanine carboxypeptidase family protein [Alicyclobacillus macrosporangiidus]SFV04151.1 D-alanyl-D-alanine carboxypeptidase/D-alanyl-D-alanine carboxypeptidase (penicillin-binding protein 5/6) [Alicyclobacillus macrosporangiidus]